MISAGFRRRLLARSRCGALCLTLAAQVAGAADGSGLELTTGSPDALCPDLAMTREAIDRRLGTLVAPYGAGWRAHYTIGHAPEGNPRDFVRLELFGPDGGLQLSRDLPLDSSCATMADVIALVLDRHFRGLSEHEREPVQTPPAPPADEPGGRVKPVVVPQRAEPDALRLLGVEIAVRYPLSPGAGLRWLGGVGDSFYWGVAASSAFVSEEERLGDGGSVKLRGVSLQVLAGIGPSFGAVRTFVGPGVRVTLDQGSARDLAEVDTRYRAVSGAGLQLGAIGPLGGRLYWMLSASLDLSLGPLSGQFVVDGREVLEPSPVQVWTSFGIGYSL